MTLTDRKIDTRRQRRDCRPKRTGSKRARVDISKCISMDVYMCVCVCLSAVRTERALGLSRGSLQLINALI